MVEVIEPEIYDLRGYQCPLPVLKTRSRLRCMAAGERVWVHTDDPLAGVDIPHFCNEFDQRLLSQESGEGDSLRFLI